MTRKDALRRTGGWTWIEALVAMVLILLALAVGVTAAEKSREDARIAHCANNLRLLAVAGHSYADDFDERFFYHWPFGSSEENKKTRTTGGWYDPTRVGRYIAGKQVGGPPGYPGPYLDEFPMGLGGRAFTCPADLPGAARSYNMNFWASGVGDLGELADRFPHGIFFDRSNDPSDKLLLFTESLSVIRTREGWVTSKLLGATQFPGQRFGGEGGFGRLTDGLLERFKINVPRTDLDYVRHDPEVTRYGGNTGTLNIAYADGHVAVKKSNDLYRAEDGRSTLNTLWSPIDAELANRLTPLDLGAFL